MNQVPNAFPSFNHDKYRIAIIADSPTGDDAQMGVPFVGPYGNILQSALQAAGLAKAACLCGHISQFVGANANDSWQVAQGKEVLRNDLLTFQPNVVLLLGQRPLALAGSHHKVADYRGSVFQCRDSMSPFYGMKCIATFDTQTIMKSYDNMPLFTFDVQRAAKEGQYPELRLPSRMAELHLTGHEICERLDNWEHDKPAAIDIEGGIKPVQPGITCMSIADSPTSSFVIDWRNMPEGWHESVFKSTHRWLRNKDIPKILQNSLYDNMCLSWQHRSPIVNVAHDTMLSGWEIYPELPKKLGVQASIWTDEPYYKDERTVADNETHLMYCCKDSMVTFEIAQKHNEYFAQHPAAEQHFKFNMSLLPSLLYSQLRGIRYDEARAKEALLQLDGEIDVLQSRVDLLCGRTLNIDSPKQMTHVLYDLLRFETQYAIEGGRKTTKRTCDAKALLKLLKKTDSDLIYSILLLRRANETRKQLRALANPDGRIRAGYNPVGTDTGRMNCYGSDTGSGYNLQTTAKPQRVLFIPDEDHYLAQIDLSGADGWTVAAHALKLGDPRMMEDYLAGVKPAKVICAMYLLQDTTLATRSSHELLQVTNSLDIPSWLYNAAKAVQHGSSYGMGIPTMIDNILKRSWKDDQNPIHINHADCKKLQDLFFVRYIGVKRWQAWVKQQIEQKGFLDCASGHRRHFFGRRYENSTLQSAYAHEPQANTTYATNLAEVKVFNSERNRRGPRNTKLIVEPLHRIHDAGLFHFHKDDLEFAIPFLKECFTNTLKIAGQDIIIPFEGEVGLYWGDNSICKI